jgi:hypothetical protein
MYNMQQHTLCTTIHMHQSVPRRGAHIAAHKGSNSVRKVASGRVALPRVSGRDTPAESSLYPVSTRIPPTPTFTHVVHCGSERRDPPPEMIGCAPSLLGQGRLPSRARSRF